MIKSSDLIKLLKDKSVEFTKEELDKIIETELEKDESEMDTELIEICLDTLNEKKQVPSKKSKKTSYVKFALFAAAAVALIFVNIAAFGKLNHNTPPVADKNDISSVTTETPETSTQESSASSTKTTATENNSVDSTPPEITPAPILKGETTNIPEADKEASTFSAEENILKKELKINGFENIILPKIIFENSEILNRNFTENKAEIKIKSKEKIYNITIEKSSEKIEETNVIDVNGLKVSAQSENNSSEIRYRKNNLNYKIVFESTLEEAVRIAKTIC